MSLAAVSHRDQARAAPGGLVDLAIENVQAHIRANGLGPGDAMPSENAFAAAARRFARGRPRGVPLDVGAAS